jgi:hypothetical protein
VRQARRRGRLLRRVWLGTATTRDITGSGSARRYGDEVGVGGPAIRGAGRQRGSPISCRDRAERGRRSRGTGVCPTPRDLDVEHGRALKAALLRWATTRAPWQNPFVERVIGSVRRECLDHFFVLNEVHLRRLLRTYLGYYNLSRPHQALGNNSPHPRNVQPPSRGRIAVIPQVGGLHHRYQRVA